MTLEGESRLSFYKELTAIDEKKNVMLVQNIEDNQIYIRKIVDIYLRSVYEQLKQFHISGIPDIIECIDDDDKLIVIEEYIQGKNLLQIMKENGLAGESYAYKAAMNLTDILIELHGMNPPVIHRDIKPSNIIIDKNGHLYLIDFDAARNVNGFKDEDTRMLGTMYFAAPEQYGFGQSDMRTDIYGLGATVNYLMTGDKPGAGVSQGRLYPVLRRCLMIDPKDRFQSAEELHRALMSVGESTGSQDRDKTGYGHEDKNYNDSWRRFLPPGFRKGNIVYAILAVLWYLFIIMISLQLEVTNNNGEPVSVAYVIINRITLFIVMLGNTLWYGNYLNIRDRFPGMDRKGFRSQVITAVYGFGFTMAAVIAMILVCEIAGV